MGECDDSRYDSIVIGGGHNGLVLACYLQRAGHRTLLLERATQLGGMSCSIEQPGPGYRHNPHANFLAYQSISPVIADLDLAGNGLVTITPPVQHGIAFDDGRPPILLHRKADDASTVRSIAQYSRHDAERWAALRRGVDALTPALRASLFQPLSGARMEAYQTAVDAALASQLRASLGQRGAAALIDEWFETAELRTLLYLLASEYGAALRQPGGDLGFAGLVLWMLGGREVPVGGMQSLADALQRAAQQAGVEVRAATPVRRLLIESGRVVGVEAGAQALRATHVISSIDLAQTFGALLGDDAGACVDAETQAALLARPGPSIASQAFALRAPPDYRSARWDADLNRCIQTYIGFNTPEDVLTHERDLTLGLLPPARASVRVPSLWDPGVAPAGCHLAGADSLFPAASTLSESEWLALEESYCDALLDTWRRAAPNMTGENVIRHHFARPQAGDRQIVIRSGSQYRTALEGLWLCGTSTYPGGGVHGACALNAFQDITGRTLP